MILLKLHAWFYRRTGIYTKYAKRKEQEYIKGLDDLTKLTPLEKDLAIGYWQARHGFYRTSKQLKKLRSKNEKK